jgi:hypothetical protein
VSSLSRPVEDRFTAALPITRSLSLVPPLLRRTAALRPTYCPTDADRRPLASGVCCCPPPPNTVLASSSQPRPGRVPCSNQSRESDQSSRCLVKLPSTVLLKPYVSLLLWCLCLFLISEYF